MRYSSVYPIIHKKIERNKCLIQIFELENKMAKLEMVIKLRILKHNELYIKDLKQLNELEAEQALCYTTLREARIKELTVDANTRQIDIEDLRIDIEECNKKIKEIVDKINILNKSIIPINFVINVDTSLGMLESEKKCNY